MIEDNHSFSCYCARPECVREREQLATLRAALELIATPIRPDGTWNRDRASCQTLALIALGLQE
jgi:hypothetical protein